TALVYSTYLGGSRSDSGSSITIDSSGNAYVTGSATSADFPITSGAYLSSKGSFNTNAFITKLNPGGTALVYSTFLGGSGVQYIDMTMGDSATGIAVDSSGNAYVTGSTYSTDFPVTTGAYQTTKKGSSNAFIAKLNSTGAALTYSTYLGGSGGDSSAGIAVDSSGNAYVTGTTASTDFPATTGAFQAAKKGSLSNAFITKLHLPSGTSDSDLAAAVITAIYNEYSTYFGTKSGGVTTGTSGCGTFYVQWFSNGTAILAWIDGYMYWTEGKNWYLADSGAAWKASGDYGKATAAINTIYNEYPTYFGIKSGGVATGTYNGGTFYVQWFTNSTAILAWTDGYMYWTEGTNWYLADGGVSWKT
ncbi:MAG: SBBP repeat-containing protein, partial [Nitrospirae bacterium]|nr:SBBP repeat-containing protein [Nitrospirota bacterium]